MTDSGGGGGGTVPLLQYIEARLRDADLRYSQRYDAQTIAVNAALLAAKEAIGAALLAAEKAVTKAEMASEKRFEAVNEFRATLADQSNTLMPRSEADARFLAMGEKLDALTTRYDKSEGTGGGAKDARAAQMTERASFAQIISVALALLFGAAGLVFGLIQLSK